MLQPSYAFKFPPIAIPSRIHIAFAILSEISKSSFPSAIGFALCFPVVARVWKAVSSISNEGKYDSVVVFS